MMYKDQLNRALQFNTAPKRIVSLVPSLTELICDLGLEASLVGVTKFCVHPQHIRTNVAVVGGTKQVHIDKIEALQPDIILCNKEENTQDIVENCSIVAQVHISDIYTIDDCLALITMYGELFAVEQKAQELVKTITAKKADFLKTIDNKPKPKVAYLIWKNPWMVAAQQTFIDYMLSINNFENVFGALQRYPEVDLKDEKFKDAEYVFLSTEPYPFKESDAIAIQASYPNIKVILVDGELFSWYGSRLIKAFDYFKKLHQEYLN